MTSDVDMSSPVGTWAGVYREADAGAVGITVQADTSVSTPFGSQQEPATGKASPELTRSPTRKKSGLLQARLPPSSLWRSEESCNEVE
jgi:hypothetical protein